MSIEEIDYKDFEKIPNINRRDKPLIIRGLAKQTTFGNWTIERLAEIKGDDVVNFKIGSKIKYCNENECLFIDATLKDFANKISGKESAFDKIPTEKYWIYADYKNFNDLFPEHKYKGLRDDLNWNIVGYPTFGALETTIWLGTGGAYTPLHYDTYGINFHAVISGVKEWVVFSPEDTLYLYPTRLPYEESSIYSLVDLNSPNYQKFPLFKHSTSFKGTLYSGDILFIPRHWWHYVSNIDTTLSINIWCKIEEDKKERVQESLIKLLISAWKGFETAKDSSYDWLNPNEIPISFDEAIAYFKLSASDLYPDKKELIYSLEPNQILDKIVSRNSINKLIHEIFNDKH